MEIDKLIITAAITGGASPESNPYLPKTPKEQVQAAIDCYNAGASIVHLHGRNPKTKKSEQKAEWFKEAIGPIREKCNIIINVTTGGAGDVWMENGYTRKSKKKVLRAE